MCGKEGSEATERRHPCRRTQHGVPVSEVLSRGSSNRGHFVPRDKSCYGIMKNSTHRPLPPPHPHREGLRHKLLILYRDTKLLSDDGNYTPKSRASGFTLIFSVYLRDLEVVGLDYGFSLHFLPSRTHYRLPLTSLPHPLFFDEAGCGKEGSEAPLSARQYYAVSEGSGQALLVRLVVGNAAQQVEGGIGIGRVERRKLARKIGDKVGYERISQLA